jgi:poly(3-hydroxybutyrate) depolymerase
LASFGLVFSLSLTLISALQQLGPCDPSTGLAAALSACSATDPCAGPGGPPITTPIDVPLCRTSDSSRLVFDDGPPEQWLGSRGEVRYSCVFRPSGASRQSPRPLVIFFHGAFGAASAVYDNTSLRARAPTYLLSGDPARPGFFLVSVQGRNLHWPASDSRDGRHHDIYYRDLKSPSTNPDLENADHIIDSFVASGAVDATRVYVMGWSNGGFFAQLYGIGRHEVPTPGRHHVAAVAVYSAADPFNNIQIGESPPCRLNPYPHSRVPILLIGRACDLVPCDEAQFEGLAAQGVTLAPGFVVQTWVSELATLVGDSLVTSLTVTGDGKMISTCTAAAFCQSSLAILNHLHWPDGISDGSGMDYEPMMLDFLRANPASITRVVRPR